MAEALARELVNTLPVNQPRLFNPWREKCSMDSPENGPEARFDRLVLHLSCEPKYILVGEAPGYQGCRYSGIAFTSERLLLAGEIPRVPKLVNRLTTRKRPFSEPSATIVWRVLHALGIADKTILWNALQLHPYPEGNIWKNREPDPDELVHGVKGMHILKDAFPAATVIPVGRIAESLLYTMNVDAAPSVRHPSFGGATAFETQLKQLISGK